MFFMDVLCVFKMNVSQRQKNLHNKYTKVGKLCFKLNGQADYHQEMYLMIGQRKEYLW